MRGHAKELADLCALDCGNAFQAMLYDADIGADYMDYFPGLAIELKRSTIPFGPDVLNCTVREPLGVVARIGALNQRVTKRLWKLVSRS